MKIKSSSPAGLTPSVILILACAITLLSTSCSVSKPKQEAKSEAVPEQEICTRLQGLIDAHPDKFARYRKNKSVTRRMILWDATILFPGANNCQVWEWAAGLSNYYCEWKSHNGMKGAQADFHKGEGILERCLGTQWTARTNTTASGGEHTRFSKEGSKTIVSIRYFKDQNWQTILYIGDKSNLNTPVQ